MDNDHEEEWLEALVDFLGVDDAAEWLRDPCLELGKESPLQLIADGRKDEVIAHVMEMVES
jgi:hypothetical protein